CSESAAKSRLWVEAPTRPGTVHAGRGVRIVEAVGLDQLQTPVEIASLDRRDKGVDHQPCGRPAGLPDRPLANRPCRSRTPVSPVLSGRDQASPTPPRSSPPRPA